MEKTQITQFHSYGLRHFTVIDDEGFTVWESKTPSEKLLSFSEQILSFFSTAGAECSYMSFKELKTNYISFFFNEKYLFIAECDSHAPLTKTTYFIPRIKQELKHLIDTL